MVVEEVGFGVVGLFWVVIGLLLGYSFNSY
jgi:hypothetical protein